MSFSLRKPALIRSLFGGYNQRVVDFFNSRGYTFVTGDLQTNDGIGASVSQSMQIVQSQVRDTSMILSFEKIASSSKQLAPQMISYIKDVRHLNLVTVDQCLDLKPYQVTGGAYQVRDNTWYC